MPLLDHFHAPIYPKRPWESFHSRWANAIADDLNRQLPEQFTAEVQIHLGTQVEADVAEIEYDFTPSNGATAVSVKTWAPPKSTMVIPAIFPDSFEVQIRDQLMDARVAAVVELVSPGNKDRPETRRAFTSKIAAYLQTGIGVIIVDIVSNRKFNLFDELLRLLDVSEKHSKFTAPLYAVALGPTQREKASHIEVWAEELIVGESLPTLPLILRRGPTVPVELEATYELACDRARIQSH